ncbi:5'(3')-deoxyribonucleotidase [Pedobacter sp. BS3]|nr:5'(3')-deoxyribonucleotidase [Pedobacter sp. BS3]
MDEVIADVINKFLRLYNRDYNVPLDIKLVPGKEFYEILPEEINQKYYEYIHEKGFFRDLELFPDAYDVIKALHDKYEVYIVSAAMEFRNSLEDKFDWLAEHLPFIDWKHIVFCGNKIVDADIMIDDRIKNFIDFKGRKLLFTSPHNMLISHYERVNNWKEVAAKLL